MTEKKLEFANLKQLCGILDFGLNYQCFQVKTFQLWKKCLYHMRNPKLNEL
ncbi:hypothetical protein Riv7116_5650 [Rivularia sp. PCC 7116]|nr:hypothetical protein Riv7116_5650 [Rivularia sp. PCC 7116]